MESVYLESSFISYLVSRPSRDLVVAAHQQVTRDWWERRRAAFRCVISQVVLDEISAGDQIEVEKRLHAVELLDILAAVKEAESLAATIMATGVLPQQAVRDAAHIAVATVHNVQYLLTWNCKHLANAQITRRIATICLESGYLLPTICTAEELLEDSGDER